MKGFPQVKRGTWGAPVSLSEKQIDKMAVQHTFKSSATVLLNVHSDVAFRAIYDALCRCSADQFGKSGCSIICVLSHSALIPTTNRCLAEFA